MLAALCIVALPGPRSGLLAQEPAAEQASDAASQPSAGESEAEPQPETGLYLGIIWLFLIIASVLGWLYVVSWVCDDAKGVGMNFRLWVSYLLGAGLFGLLLSILLHGALSLVTVACVAGTFSVYVKHRNRVVPGQFKLFSKTAKATAGAPAAAEGETGEEGGPQLTLEVDLLNESGRSLSQFVEGRPELFEAVRAIGDLVTRAVTGSARSMRLEPTGEEHIVRFDLDGVTRNVDAIPSEVGRVAVACVAKFGGGSRGRMTALLANGDKVEVTARAVKGKSGAALVVSLPDWTKDIYKGGFAALGMHESMAERVMRAVGTPRCAVLVSSPPDSGRTSTFYAIVSEIDIFTTDVVVLEQTIQHELEQVVRHEVDMASPEFPALFAGILRDEPHVIAVDELSSAKQGGPLFRYAADDGRLIATIEADNAGQATQRLLLGVDPELVSQTLACVLNQRLLRKLCENCKEPLTPSRRLLEKLQIDPRQQGTWFKSVGCERCLNTGYRGRTAIFEMLLVNDGVRRVIAGGHASADAIRKAAGKSALRTLLQDGILKVRQGVTTIEEVRRVLQ